MPVLQLVNGILATLGPKHATAAQQVLPFSLHANSCFLMHPFRH